VPLHEQVAAVIRRAIAEGEAREFVALARHYGYRPEELAEIIEQVS